MNLAKAAKHGAETHPETEAERVGRAIRAAAEGHVPRSRRQPAPDSSEQNPKEDV